VLLTACCARATQAVQHSHPGGKKRNLFAIAAMALCQDTAFHNKNKALRWTIACLPVPT